MVSLNSHEKDIFWMRQALELAEQAASRNEVPVGAIITLGDRVVATGSNSVIELHDPTAHAEIIALRNAGAHEKNYRFPGAHMYVTLEPCTMCMGALIHARIERLVFGALDPKTGAAGSLYTIGELEQLNHQIHIERGVLAGECSTIIKEFFKMRRKNKKNRSPISGD